MQKKSRKMLSDFNLDYFDYFNEKNKIPDAVCQGFF